MPALSGYESGQHAGKSKFRFTLDEAKGKLNNSQREFYEKNGFLVIPNLVPEPLIDECRERFLDIVNGVVDSGAILKMKDLSLKDKKGLPSERVYNKIQDFVWDEVLAKYICLPEVLDYVECFTGPNIRAVHSMLINKPPDSGNRTSTTFLFDRLIESSLLGPLWNTSMTPMDASWSSQELTKETWSNTTIQSGKKE